MKQRHTLSLNRCHARGMTLIEIMVALAITSFLMVGLFTIVQTMLLVSNNQTALALLQDNERLAMTRVADVIEQAGYFTLPLLKTPVSALPAATVTVNGQTLTFAADQSVIGTHVAASAPQDTFTIRYLTGVADNLINCDGTVSVPVGLIYNTYAIDASGDLTCTVTTTIAGVTTPGLPVILVSGASSGGVAGVAGLKDMVVLYGVNTSGHSSNPVDSYMTASAIAASATPSLLWLNVLSLRVSLVFKNPLYNAAGPTSQQYPQQIPFIQISRVIDIMNRAGINST
jgi:type IV pilus assembly protein PilW